MFEEVIENIIKQVSPTATAEDLHRALQDMDSKDASNFAVEMLCAITDYNNFVDLMKGFKDEKAQEEAEWLT